MTDLDFSRIHRFTMGGMHLVLDINSGSIHVLDDTADDYLTLRQTGMDRADAVRRLAETVGEEDAADVAQGIDDLIESGMLFSDIDFSDYQPHTQPIVKALCLHLAHDCNLRCQYCFADTGAYGGPRGLMSMEVARGAIDFLMQASGHRQHVEVDLFGGEPLLNKEVCKEIVTYGRKRAAECGKTIKLTITTNGTLLDEETIHWIDDNDIDAVLSLDGRKEVHDRMRPFAGGQPSYDRAVKAFRRFDQVRGGRGWYYMRGTYTHYNTDFANDVIHMADDLGFKDLSMEPVVAPKDMPYMLQEEDKPALMASYDKLAQHYLERWREGKGYEFYHFNVDFAGGPCLPKRLSGCGSGHDYLAVSPEGDLYPCHQFVGEEDYKMGTVFDGIQKPEIAERFQKANVLTKPVCMQCWARFFCSGGCHANNIRYGGGINQPYTFGCDLQRKRIECAIYVQTVKLLEGQPADQAQKEEEETHA